MINKKGRGEKEEMKKGGKKQKDAAIGFRGDFIQKRLYYSSLGHFPFEKCTLLIRKASS